MLELLKTKPTQTLKVLDHLKKNFDSFDDVFEALSHFHGFPLISGIPHPDFSPSLEMVEKKDKYLTSIEIPGMSKEDVDISINEENNTLIIKGEKKKETTEEGDDYCVSERTYGSFRREIILPKDIAFENISANYKDGVLKLELPKKEKKEEKNKKINIKID